MTQYLRPEADTYIGNYEDELGGTSDIFESINEVSAGDADYVISPHDPTDEVYVCGLTTATDPETMANHVVRYRYAKSAEFGDQTDLVVELREGYTNEGSQGSLIKQWTHSDISAVLTTAEQTLSDAEADSITDYSDLFLRFVFNTT